MISSTKEDWTFRAREFFSLGSLRGHCTPLGGKASTPEHYSAEYRGSCQWQWEPASQIHFCTRENATRTVRGHRWQRNVTERRQFFLARRKISLCGLHFVCCAKRCDREKFMLCCLRFAAARCSTSVVSFGRFSSEVGLKKKTVYSVTFSSSCFYIKFYLYV